MAALRLAALRRDCTATALALTMLVGSAAAGPNPLPAASVDDTRHVLTLLAAVGEEYREGVQDGRVVRAIEFDEAKVFLQDAQDRLQRVTPEGTGSLAPLFADAARMIEAKSAPDAVAQKLAALRQAI